jgi:acyl carrier protein
MIDRGQIVEALLGQVVALLPEAGKIGLTEDTDLRDFAGFDSITIVQLLMWAEAAYGISLTDDEEAIGRASSVSGLADYLVKRWK